MEIKLNTNIESVGKLAGSYAKKIEAKVADEGPAFSKSEALETALRQTPDLRADVVAKSKELVADKTYPPVETIKKIAVLLAQNMPSEE